MLETIYMGKAEPGFNKDCVEVVTTMPEASSSLGKIVLFNGTTSESYTNGYIYKALDVVQTPAVPQSLTVTQTAGEDLGTITTNIGVFKSAIGNDVTHTYVFSCIGKPRIISVEKMNGGMFSDSFTRDTTHDAAQLHKFGWVNESNNWFFTNTETPDETTVFYLGDADEIGTATTTNSGWIYISTTARQTTGMGIWVIGVNEVPVELSDYGIYCSSVGLIGDKLSVAYVKAVAQVSNSAWQRVTVQPLDLTQVSGYDATKNQTLKNSAGTIAWIDNV